MRASPSGESSEDTAGSFELMATMPRFRCVVPAQLRKLILDVLHERAVVADERYEQGSLAFEGSERNRLVGNDVGE
jgi:hypothetical protein